MRKNTTARPFVGQRTVIYGLPYVAKLRGVSVGHLRMVIQGKRDSRTLIDWIRNNFPSLLGELPQ